MDPRLLWKSNQLNTLNVVLSTSPKSIVSSLGQSANQPKPTPTFTSHFALLLRSDPAVFSQNDLAKHRERNQLNGPDCLHGVRRNDSRFEAIQLPERKVRGVDEVARIEFEEHERRKGVKNDIGSVIKTILADRNNSQCGTCCDFQGAKTTSRLHKAIRIDFN